MSKVDEFQIEDVVFRIYNGRLSNNEMFVGVGNTESDFFVMSSYSMDKWVKRWIKERPELYKQLTEVDSLQNERGGVEYE